MKNLKALQNIKQSGYNSNIFVLHVTENRQGYNDDFPTKIIIKKYPY